MTFRPFFPWCCDQELATCSLCDRPVPTCLRVTVYDCTNGYDYGYGDCDCTTFNGTYFVRGVTGVSRLYLRDPGSYCGDNYFETQNACVWWGYVCNPVKRCGPEPCKTYDRIAFVLGPRIGAYGYSPTGCYLWVVFYDSQDAPHGLPGVPSKTDMLGTQLVIDGVWHFEESESGIICDDFTLACGGNGEVSCVAGGDDCIDMSTCRFACRVRIQAIECDQASLACNSFPCESCCRGTRPNAVTVTLLNPPSELACLENWPHNVLLSNNPDCTKPCVYKGDFLCDSGYGYGNDGHIEVTVTRDTNHGLISVDAYFRGATYRKVVDDSCDSLSLLDLDYVSGKVNGDIDVSGTKLRVEANAGGARVTPDSFVGICDQECQPPLLLITIDGFEDWEDVWRGITYYFSKFNGDYVISAGEWSCLYSGLWTRCAGYKEIYTVNEPLNELVTWKTAHISLIHYCNNVSLGAANFMYYEPIAGRDIFVTAYFYGPYFPWDCSSLDITMEASYVFWGEEQVYWPITMRVRLLE